MTPALLVISTDVPLPARSGGRIDVWRRLQALHEAGWRLGLACWRDAGRGSPDDAQADAELRTVCEMLQVQTITHHPVQLLRRLCCLPWLPSHAAARWVTADRQRLLDAARRFRPHAVLVDGLYGGAVGAWLARKLGCRLLYRAHNMEHRYMAAQRALAADTRSRLGLTLNLLGLERFERRLRQNCDEVFDISPDDLREWQASGLSGGVWLPTAVPAAVARALDRGPGYRWDILYFGNLNTPNNVDAVRWLVDDVLPRLPSGVRVGIAGSAPGRALLDSLGRHPEVELVQDPAVMEDLVVQARVLINPVRASSGVNLKSVEMLFSRAALVSTSAGVRGLPRDAAACFAVADDASGFAAAIEHALQHGADWQDRLTARQAFTADHTVTCLTAGLTAAPRRPAHEEVLT